MYQSKESFRWKLQFHRLFTKHKGNFLDLSQNPWNHIRLSYYTLMYQNLTLTVLVEWGVRGSFVRVRSYVYILGGAKRTGICHSRELTAISDTKRNYFSMLICMVFEILKRLRYNNYPLPNILHVRATKVLSAFLSSIILI